MANIVEKIKDKTKKKLYNEARNAYLRKSICNIGRVVETDDRIICYVEQNALDKYKGNKPIYDLMLLGMNVVTDGIRETTEAFGLDKDVYYIFDGIKFDTGLQFTSTWCNVTFKNCIFEKSIYITWGNEITFENNKYKDHCNVYFIGNCFLTANSVKKITFVNESFVNSYELKQYGDQVFGMKIDAREVDFVDSIIVCENTGGIDIDAVITRLENSAFIGKDISIKSTSIKSSDTSITGKESVIIENSNCDFDGEVKSPIMFYNGVDLSNKSDEKVKVDIEEAKLRTAREKLVLELRRIRDYCSLINEEKVQNVRDELNNQTIVKTLTQR